MECDLGRLNLAIEAKAEADGRDWRHRWRIAGHEVEEPSVEPKTAEEFNAQVADTLASLKGRSSSG